MRFLSILFLSFAYTVVSAQTNEKDEIMKVINNMFEAMRTSDSSLLKSCFIENPNTFTVSKSMEGDTKFRSDDFQRFIDGVGKPKDKVWDEPIWNEKVEIDGDLASVWVDYVFYLGDQFSHCGVDAFHLVRQEGTWKIFHLVDTRRKEGCDVPSQMIPGNESTTLLTSIDQLSFNGLTATKKIFKNREAFAVSTSDGNGGDGITSIKNLNFKNGTIEVELIGMPKKNAPNTARGFVGIAFRIGDDEKYECFYIRPTNSRTENQLRRNHSVQYVSHPDHRWFKLRKEEPGLNESYADMKADEWTKLRIEVNGEKAELFINNSEQPVLIINNLKLGSDRVGGVGFWTYATTEAYFANLKIAKKD